jgi:uncharacterized transporter YbjL
VRLFRQQRRRYIGRLIKTLIVGCKELLIRTHAKSNGITHTLFVLGIAVIIGQKVDATQAQDGLHLDG